MDEEAECQTHDSCKAGHYCQKGEAGDVTYFLGVENSCVKESHEAGGGVANPSLCAPVLDLGSACTFHEICDTRFRYCDPATKTCQHKAAKNDACTSTEACQTGFVCGQDAGSTGLPECRPNPAPPSPPGELVGATCGVGGKTCGTGLYCGIKEKLPFETIVTPFLNAIGDGATAAANALGSSAELDLNPPIYVPRLCVHKLHHDPNKNFQANQQCETDEDCLGYCNDGNVCQEAPESNVACNDCTELQYCDPVSLTCKDTKAVGAGCRTHKECGEGGVPMYCDYANPSAFVCAKRKLKLGSTERGCTCKVDYGLEIDAGTIRYSGCMQTCEPSGTPPPCDGDDTGTRKKFPSTCVIEPGCAGAGGRDWDYCHIIKQSWEDVADGEEISLPPCIDDEECPVDYYCAQGTCKPTQPLNGACDTGRECTSGRCAVASYCSFFKTQLESPATYANNCNGCSIQTMFTPGACAFQEVTVDLAWTLLERGTGDSTTLNNRLTNSEGRGIALTGGFGVGVNLLALGPSFKISARYGGTWMGFSVGAAVSLTNPGSQAGFYSISKTAWDRSPAALLAKFKEYIIGTKQEGRQLRCRPGYFCPLGLEEGTLQEYNTDFSITGKYHGGSPAWKATPIRERKDLRCGANYFCPGGSTTEQGKPVGNINSPVAARCLKNKPCPCISTVLGKYCGLAAKIKGGTPIACNRGYYCEGGERKRCKAGYFCSRDPTLQFGRKKRRSRLLGLSNDPETEGDVYECKAGYYCPEGSTTDTGQPVIDPVETGPGDAEKGRPDTYEFKVDSSFISPDTYKCHGADTPGLTASEYASEYATAQDCLCFPGYYCPKGSRSERGEPLTRTATSCQRVTATAGQQSTCNLGPAAADEFEYICTAGERCKCGGGHYCPRGSTSPQGRPLEAHSDSVSSCNVDQACTCKAGFYCEEGMSSVQLSVECRKNFYCPEGETPVPGSHPCGG